MQKEKKKEFSQFLQVFINKFKGKFIYRGYRGAFKKQSLRWVFQATGYVGGLRGMQHPSQQEAESLAQGALRQQEYTLLLSMKISKISPFAHTPLRAAESAGSFHKG